MSLYEPSLSSGPLVRESLQVLPLYSFQGNMSDRPFHSLKRMIYDTALVSEMNSYSLLLTSAPTDAAPLSSSAPTMINGPSLETRKSPGRDVKAALKVAVCASLPRPPPPPCRSWFLLTSGAGRVTCRDSILCDVLHVYRAKRVNKYILSFTQMSLLLTLAP